MEHSQEVEGLFAALSQAQGEMPNVKKDSTNPFFKSKYADLAACWDACRATLSKHGLSVMQIPDGPSGLITVLGHTSGQWISGRVEMTLTKNDPQGLGSALTYARRYALSAFIGLASEDDDDGNAASQAPAKKPRKKAPEQPSKEQVEFLEKLLDSSTVTNDEREKTWTRLIDADKTQFSKAITYWKDETESRRDAKPTVEDEDIEFV